MSMTVETETVRQISSVGRVLTSYKDLDGKLISLLLAPDEANKISIVGFKLFFPKDNDEVYYGFLCSPYIAKNVAFSFDESENLLVTHPLGKNISLGNPSLGGLSPNGDYKVKDIEGGKLGSGLRAFSGRKRRELGLEYRSLFADPIVDNGNRSVVLSGLYYDSGKRLRVLKLVKTSRTGSYNFLAEEVMEIINNGKT